MPQPLPSFTAPIVSHLVDERTAQTVRIGSLLGRPTLVTASRLVDPVIRCHSIDSHTGRLTAWFHSAVNLLPSGTVTDAVPICLSAGVSEDIAIAHEQSIWLLNVRSGDARRIHTGFAVPAHSEVRLLPHQVDGIGAEELIVSTDERIFMLSLDPVRVIWQRFGLGGALLELGEFDGDPSREIVVSQGVAASNHRADVLDVETGAIVRTIGGDSWLALAVGDADRDGLDEIFALDQVGRNATDLICLDLYRREPWVRWRVSGASAFDAADLDHDGRLEIVARLQTGVHVLLAGSGAIVDSLNASGDGYQLADLSGDGLPELITTTYYGLVGIHNIDPNYAIWMGDTPAKMSWSDVVVGDFDNDGSIEVAAVSTTIASLYGGQISVWSADDLQQKYVSARLPFGHGSNIYPYALTSADFDGDGRLEFLFAAGRSSHHNDNPRFYLQDDVQSGFQDLWYGLGPTGMSLGLGLDVGDVDADSTPEFSVHHALESPPFSGQYVVHATIRDYPSNTILFDYASPSVAPLIRARFLRIPGRSMDDFLVMANGRIMLYDPRSSAMIAALPGGAYSAFEVIDGIGGVQILAGTRQGQIERWIVHAAGLRYLGAHAAATQPIEALSMDRGANRLAFQVNGRLETVDLSAQQRLWTSRRLSSRIGHYPIVHPTTGSVLISDLTSVSLFE